MKKKDAGKAGSMIRDEIDYKVIFDNSAAGIAQVSLEGKFLKVNRYFSKITGYSEKELLGLSFVDITHPEDIDKDVEFVKKLVSGHIKKYSMHKRYIRKNKKHVWINLTGSLVLNNDKSPAFFVAVIEDISDYKKKEIELFQSEERYKTLVELSPLAIAVHVKGYFRYVNNACLKMFKADSIHDFKDLRFINMIPKREQKAVTGRTGEIRNSFSPVETVIKDLCGKEIPVMLFENNIYFQGKAATLVIINDISEKKRNEAEQRLLIDKLTDKNEELERIVYISSHDMRSPLINIEGWSKHLAEQFEAVSDFFQKPEVENLMDDEVEDIVKSEIPLGLNYINQSVAKMAGLLNGLLDVSRTGQINMKIQSINMNDLLGKVVDSMKFQINSSGAKVSVSDLHSCFGDPNMINQIFSNLLDNSLKYRSENRNLRITVKSEKKEEYVLYSFRDNGKGIPEDKLEAVFDLFNKIDPYSEGLGLGLSIVKKIINRHGGDIRVSSKEDSYTRFSILLPQSARIIEGGQ